MKKFSRFSAVAMSLAALVLPAPASAALVNQAVPTNAYITFNGFDWAWAAPVYPSEVDLSFQSQFGWRLPTAAELLLAPAATQFMFAGANVPLGGSDPVSGATFTFSDGTSLTGPAALAAPYFSNYSHGDWCNGQGSNCTGNLAGQSIAWNSPTFVSESLVLRVSANNAVPEPSTWAMMLLGFGAVGFSIRRRGTKPRPLAQLA